MPKPLLPGCTVRLLRRRAYHPSGRVAEPGDVLKIVAVESLDIAPEGDLIGLWAVWSVPPALGCSSLFGPDTACAPACDVEVIHAAGECS